MGFAVGSFITPSSPGLQSIADVGGKPTGLLLFHLGWDGGVTTAESSVPHDAGYGSVSLGFAGTEGGSIVQAAVGYNHAGALRGEQGVILKEAEGIAVLDSTNANGFTLEWQQAENHYRVFYLAFFGPIAAQAAFQTVPAGATGVKSLDVGFPPDAALVLSSSVSGATPGPSASLGFIDSAGNQATWAAGGRASAGTDTHYATDFACAAGVNAQAVTHRALFDSYDDQGVNLNVDQAPVDTNLAVLCLRFVQSAVGINTIGMLDTGGGVDTVTGLPFTPEAVLLTTARDTDGTFGPNARGSVGASAGGAGRSASILYRVIDGSVRFRSWHYRALLNTFDSANNDGAMKLRAFTDDPTAGGGYEVETVDRWGSALPSFDAFHLALAAVNVAPLAPHQSSPVSGQSVDRTQPVTLNWSFQDPNPGDDQSAYEAEWRQQGTAVATSSGQVTSTTTSHDIAAGSLTDGVGYEWRARTADVDGAWGPWSGWEPFVAHDPPTPPTITDPADGAEVTYRTTVSWTAGEQAAYQLRRVADDGAGNPDLSTVHYDSGTVEQAATRSHDLVFETNNRDEHVQVRVRFDGLWSTWASVGVSVAWTAPAEPAVTVTPGQPEGATTVSAAHPAPSGAQPTVVSQDIRRRATAEAGPGQLVAEGLAPDAAWVDWLVASNVDYEYQVVVHGDNGVDLATPWTGADLVASTESVVDGGTAETTVFDSQLDGGS